MMEGVTTAHYSARAFGFTNEQRELRGGKLFLSHIWKPVRFFFPFCSVNPNLKDLKPASPFKTESLFVLFLDEEEGEKWNPTEVFPSFLYKAPRPLWKPVCLYLFTFPHSQAGQLGERQAVCRQWRLRSVCPGSVWGFPLEQFANGPERGRLGGSAKGPLSSSRSCETKWNLSQKRKGLENGVYALRALWWVHCSLPVPAPSGEQGSACLCRGPGIQVGLG